MKFDLIDFKWQDELGLIAVYCNCQSTDRFLVGKVISSDSCYIVLSLVSPKGKSDGICLCSTSSIYRIETNSQYLERLAFGSISLEKNFFSPCIWDSFWENAEKSQWVTQIKGISGKRIMFGVPICHTPEYVVFRCISTTGKKGKIRCMNRRLISIATCNSKSEKLISARLRRNNHKNQCNSNI